MAEKTKQSRAAGGDTNRDQEDISDALDSFKLHQDAWTPNRNAFMEDIRFGLKDEQWPDYAKKARGENRPMLTINKLKAFGRQVTNDCRLNRPSIKVRPVDNGADVRTAQVYSGLIRNIEQISSADIAYDTAVTHSVYGGFGFWRVAIEYAHDDSFEKDLLIKRIANARSVWPDPFSTEADSSDWNSAFVTDMMPKAQFERRYKGAEPVDWDGAHLESPWLEGEEIMLAERWYREEEDRRIYKLNTGAVVDEKTMAMHAEAWAAMGITSVGDRMGKAWCVYQHLMTGAEVLERNKWAGRYIPIIACYGDEVNIDGEREFHSLIRSAKDAQRMFNFWRTTATETVALQPKAPWLIHDTAMPEDEQEAAKWKTANTANHDRLMWSGAMMPQRVSYAGTNAAAINEAMLASDDMKSIIGMYDASLGAKSNETSGVAIERRKLEGDTSTFHFIDNLSRAIAHCGRVLIDLIPKVYSGERMIRVLGEDGTARSVSIKPRGEDDPNAIAMQALPADTQELQPNDKLEGVFDLGAGKYDLAVSAGPSFSTRRVEASAQMTEIMAQNPEFAKVFGDIWLRMQDWPGADEAAARVKRMLPPEITGEGQENPQLMQAQQAIAALTEQLNAAGATVQQKDQELAVEKQKTAVEMKKLEVESQKTQVEAAKVAVEARNMTVTEQGANDQTMVSAAMAQTVQGLQVVMAEATSRLTERPQL
jgi:hypothetical protein